MLTLYYSPGACSLAAHVALEEAGAPFEARPVMLAKGEHLTEEYRRINPQARVPALRVEDGRVLTETVAILPYVARRFPDAGLLPGDPFTEAEALSLMGFLSGTVHIAFAHLFRPGRYAADEAVHGELKSTARGSLPALFAEIDARLRDRAWAVGEFGVCDPYVMVFYRWAARTGFPMEGYPAWTAHKDRVQQRPSVRRVLEREGLTPV